MHYYPQTSPRTRATQSHGLQSRTPRTMPVTSPDSMDFTATTMAAMPSSNFSLTSSFPPSRQSHGVNPALVSYNSFPDSSSGYYSLSTPSTMSYGPITSGGQYSTTMMPTMGSFELDSTNYDLMVNDVLSSNPGADISFSSLTYQGQGQSQDALTPYMDVSGCNPSVMNNFYSQDPFNWIGSITRPDTPPPEDIIQEFLPQQQYNTQDCHQDIGSNDPDTTVFEMNCTSRSSAYSTSRRDVAQPRPIRSASERSDASTEHNISVDARIVKDDQGDKVKARSHPLYDAKPHEDGKFYCPMKATAGCNHEPTGQRCIYNKYLDSHLRPYRCKYADRGDCEETRFSSNACLFRHEREAHGLHNHGVNPYLCKFANCDRSRPGNGFPRRWNQRDHMKRVHEWTEESEDAPKDRSNTSESSKRRKGLGIPSSTAMKRSTSSALAKAQALADAALPKYRGRVDSGHYGQSRQLHWGDRVQRCVSPGPFV